MFPEAVKCSSVLARECPSVPGYPACSASELSTGLTPMEGPRPLFRVERKMQEALPRGPWANTRDLEAKQGPERTQGMQDSPPSMCCCAGGRSWGRPCCFPSAHIQGCVWHRWEEEGVFQSLGAFAGSGFIFHFPFPLLYLQRDLSSTSPTQTARLLLRKMAIKSPSKPRLKLGGHSCLLPRSV